MRVLCTAWEGAARVLKVLAIAALCLTMGALSAQAANYYVSSSQGNDANAGTDSAAPWQTLTNVYKFTETTRFQPGDSILLKAGDSFDGPLYIHQGGTQGSRLTVDRYGTGANPIIYGDHPTATWSAVSGHAGIYSALIGPSGLVSVQSVYDSNGNAYTKSAQGTNSLDAWLNTFVAYSWGGNNIIYLETPDGNPPPKMRVMEQNVIGANSVGYLTIQNLEVCNSFIGIEPAMCSYLLIQNNFVHDTLNSAIYFAKCSFSVMGNNTVLRTGNTQLYLQNAGNNWIHHNTCSTSGNNRSGCTILGIQVPLQDGCGVGLQQGTNNLVEYNSFSYIYSSCIDYYYEVNTEVRYNYGFHSGQAADTDGTGLLFHHNIFNLDGIGQGIQCAQAYDPRYSPVSNNIPQIIYDNVVYNCIAYGLYTSAGPLLTGTSTNVVLRNNIVVTTQANQFLAQLNPGVDSDYNLYYCTAGSSRGWQGSGSSYSTLGAMQTGSGQEAHSIYASPQFVSSNPVSVADFNLKSTSPCIGVGLDLRVAGLLAPAAAYQDYLGVVIPQGPAPCIGAYEPVAPPTNLRKSP